MRKRKDRKWCLKQRSLGGRWARVRGRGDSRGAFTPGKRKEEQKEENGNAGEAVKERHTQKSGPTPKKKRLQELGRRQKTCREQIERKNENGASLFTRLKKRVEESRGDPGEEQKGARHLKKAAKRN